MQKNTEQKDWLVTAPKGQLKDTLTMVCYGNRRLSGLLYYFLFAANYVANDSNLDKETVESITVKKDQDKILEDLFKYADVKITKKTFIAWTSKLQDYNYVTADGRRHEYTVNVKAIRAAIKEPPVKEAPLLRGRHAKKDQSQKVKTTNDTVKTTSQAQNDVKITNGEFVVLTQEFVKLQLAFNLLSESFVKLQLEQSRQAARIAELEAKEAPQYKLNTNSNINSNTNLSASAVASSQHEEKKGNVIDFSSRTESRTEKVTTKPTRKPSSSKSNNAPTQPALPVAVFNEREQAVYDAWARSKYLRGVPPPINDTLIGHIKTLTKYEVLPTTEEMEAVKAWKQAQNNSKKIGWYLGSFVSAYPGWLSLQPATEDQEKPSSKTPATSVVLKPDTQVYWNTDGVKECSTGSRWKWMSYAEALKITPSFTPNMQPEQWKIKDFELAKAEHAQRLREREEDEQRERAAVANR